MSSTQASTSPAAVFDPTVHLKDYTPSAYVVETVDLTFDLDPAKTKVLSRLRVMRNPAATLLEASGQTQSQNQPQVQPLILDGEDITLARVLINGQGAAFRLVPAPGSAVEIGATPAKEGEGAMQLIIDAPPQTPFDLEIYTLCKPELNTQLSGLYTSQGTFFTQCEAEGFRRITYFLDRPDVMASYRVTLRANKAAYPVLLSNGNLLEQSDLADGRHQAVWQDPHKKPSYLFALVAGNFVAREQRIRTASGAEHLLQVYVRAGDLDKTEHAMASLIKSIAWDEARYGLKLDLERFMIVATSDFNMGAMENKGLNVFNTKYVLANAATATDVDYDHIEAVVGHEYFHNWTGNRVTCRDWFQLSLKEGLTVFRDQEFSQDLAAEQGGESARAVKRIEDVRVLRQHQFAEDAGPMAHPVRPPSYREINNFYTVTLYEKGAEVVRMMQTLLATPANSSADPLGREAFARGLALYFERHDGQAVTCDDFAAAMADAHPQSVLAQNLAQFKRWYTQAGTPRLEAVGAYDAVAQRYTLTLTQSFAPQHSANLPMVIPVRCALLGGQGQTVLAEQVLVLKDAAQDFVFEGVAATQGADGSSGAPLASVLRGFSAPVKLQVQQAENAPQAPYLAALQFETDAFNRWEAAQQIMQHTALSAVLQGAAPEFDAATLAAFAALLDDTALAPAFKELALTLPSEAYLAELVADTGAEGQANAIDPQRIHAVRHALQLQLAAALQPQWLAALAAHQSHAAAHGHVLTPAAAGLRALANLALRHVLQSPDEALRRTWGGKALQTVKDSGNMTLCYGALSALVLAGHDLAAPALERFYARFKHEALVIDKWFALQAGGHDVGGSVLPQVRQLMQHPDFSLKNPNRARSLVSTLCHANPAAFHRADAAGYVFWTEQVLALDALNPQVAARLARALDGWKKLAPPYAQGAQEALNRVAQSPTLSRDVREVVERALA